MASRSVNKVILIGNLGRDAETKFTPSGTSLTRFSVATTRSWKDQQTNEWKEETDWHNIILWRMENFAPYLTKGKQVYVEGRLQTRSYEDKDGQKKYSTEVVADQVILLGGRGESGGPADAGGYSQEPRMVSQPRPAAQRPQSGAMGGGAAAQQQGPPSGGGSQFDAEISDDDVPF